jgi:hypothetical protein
VPLRSPGASASRAHQTVVGQGAPRPRRSRSAASSSVKERGVLGDLRTCPAASGVCCWRVLLACAAVSRAGAWVLRRRAEAGQASVERRREPQCRAGSGAQHPRSASTVGRFTRAGPSPASGRRILLSILVRFLESVITVMTRMSNISSHSCCSFTRDFSAALGPKAEGRGGGEGRGGEGGVCPRETWASGQDEDATDARSAPGSRPLAAPGSRLPSRRSGCCSDAVSRGRLVPHQAATAGAEVSDSDMSHTAASCVQRIQEYNHVSVFTRIISPKCFMCHLRARYVKKIATIYGVLSVLEHAASVNSICCWHATVL